MPKKQYTVAYLQLPETDSQFQKEVPIVVEADAIPHNGNPLTWREAKKEVRSFYLKQAQALRSFTEKDL